MFRPTLIAAASAVCLVATTASAAEWAVGLGAAVGPQYEGSDDYTAVPLFSVIARNLYHPATYAGLSGPRFSSNFLAHDSLRAGLSAEYVPERGALNDIDNDRVDALSDTEDGLMLGVLVGYHMTLDQASSMTFELDSRYDVNDEIGGLVTLRGRHKTKLGDKWSLTTELEGTYASESYMNEYFGVNAANAGRSGLDQFQADAGVKDATLRMAATYRFNQSWSGTLLASVKQLLGDAADSPITDDEGSATQLLGGASINFHF
jgi:outer membrane protein